MDALDRECLAELPEALALIPVAERGNTAAILKEMRHQKLIVAAIVPALKQIVADAVAPLQKRIAELETARAASGRRRTSSRVTPRDDDGGA